MRLCDQCGQPCKPRKDRPGKFFALCEKHYARAKRQANRESYRRFKAQRTQRHRAWRMANIGYVRQTEAFYHALRKDEEIRKAIQWAKENPERRKDIEKRYRSTPKGKLVSRRRDHRKHAAAGDYTEAQWLARLAFWGWRCYLCEKDWFTLAPKDRTIDHVIPLSRGGTNWPSNLRPACRSCNSSKNNTLPTGYVPGVG